MGASDYLERYLGEMTVLRAFEAGALDYLLINYFAIGSAFAPKREQKRSVFCDQYAVQFCCQMHTATRNSLMLMMASHLRSELPSGLGVDREAGVVMTSTRT
jgi:hypothetical protein